MRPRCETVCDMKTTNMSSLGSIQKVVPAAPDQFISPTDLAIGRKRLGDQRLFCWIGHIETGVLHAQWIEDALFLELIERFSGSDLDHPAEDVSRMAVVPGRAGLIGEGELCERVGKAGIV